MLSNKMPVFCFSLFHPLIQYFFLMSIKSNIYFPFLIYMYLRDNIQVCPVSTSVKMWSFFPGQCVRWLEHRPTHQGILGSIPSWKHIPGLHVWLSAGGNQSVSLSLSFLLSLPHPKNQWKKYSLVRIKKIITKFIF